MAILGYILIGIGVIGLLGNLASGTGVRLGDPDPLGRTKRFGCFVIIIAAGVALVISQRG